MKEKIDDYEEFKQEEQKDSLIIKDQENGENNIKIKSNESNLKEVKEEIFYYDDMKNFKNYFNDEENEKLLDREQKKEKLGLTKILNRLREDFNSKEYDTLNDIYEQYLINENIEKKSIKEETGRCSLDFMCCFMSPAFIIVNLIGVFESISIMNVIFETLKNSVSIYFNSLGKDKEEIEKFSINDINNNYNFYNLLLKNSKNDTFDFNLMMLMAFLGDICFKSLGFIASTSIFGVINIISFFLITNFSFYDYNPENNAYSIFKIIYLFICWLLLFIGVGSSALFSQHIIIESYDKYNKHLVKLNQKTKNLWGEKMENIILKKLERKMVKDLAYKKELEEIKIDENEEKKEELDEKEENIKKDINNGGEEEKEKENIIEDQLKISKNEEEDIVLKETELNKERKDEDKIIISKNEEKDEEKIILKEPELNEERKDEDKIAFKDILSNIKEVEEIPKFNRRAKTIYIKEKEEEKKEKKKENEAKVKKLKEESKNKFSYFFLICLTTITGYFLKYLFNIIIFERNEIKNDEYFGIIGCDNNVTCFDIIFNDKNFSKSHPNEFNNVVQRIFNDDKISFYAIAVIYLIAIVLSIILYIIVDTIFIIEKNEKDKDKNEKEKKNIIEKIKQCLCKKGNKKENKYKVCEICGYIIYSENITLNEDDQKCECLKLICETLRDCINLVIQSLCVCFAGFITKEGREEIAEEDICCFNGKINQICCCCCDFKKDDYQKREEFFCYCYQAKRKQSCLNKFMTSNVQKKIFPYMFEYFLLRIVTIGFEKKYYEIKDNENYSYDDNVINNTLNINVFKQMNETNNTDSFNNINEIFTNDDLYSFISFIGTFFLFIYFTFSYNGYISMIAGESKYDDENDDKIKKWSKGILEGTHGILLINSLFSLICSSLYLSNEENSLFQNDNFVFIPILMNKFYHFLLVYFCISYSEENKKLELITGSTLISLYLSLWDLILYLLREYISLKSLFITQIVLSSLPCLLVAFFFFHFLGSLLCFQWREALANFCCLFSHIFCFGAFWADFETCSNLIDNLFPEELNRIHALMPFFQSFSYISYFSYSEKDHCCEGSCYCCVDCLNYFKCLNCCDYLGCYFCNCCVCYDCCDCCAFFWCCDDYCSCNC